MPGGRAWSSSSGETPAALTLGSWAGRLSSRVCGGQFLHASCPRWECRWAVCVWGQGTLSSSGLSHAPARGHTLSWVMLGISSEEPDPSLPSQSSQSGRRVTDRPGHTQTLALRELRAFFPSLSEYRKLRLLCGAAARNASLWSQGFKSQLLPLPVPGHQGPDASAPSPLESPSVKWGEGISKWLLPSSSPRHRLLYRGDVIYWGEGSV